MFGAYAAILVVVTLAVQVGEFGFSTLMWRQVAMAGGEPRRAGMPILRSATLGGLLVGLLLAVLSPWLAPDALRLPPLSLASVALGTVVLRVIALNYEGYLKGRERFGALLCCSLLGRGLHLLLAVVVVNPGDLTLAVCALGVASAAQTAVLRWATGPLRVTQPATAMDTPRHWRLALPLALAGLCGFFYTRVDVLVLSLYHASTQVAMYEMADRLFQAPLLVVGAIVAVLAPRTSRRLAEGRETELRHELRIGYRLALLVTVPAALLFWFAADPLFAYLAPSYRQAVPLLAVLAPLVVIKGLGQVLVATRLLASGHHWWFSAVTVTGAVLNLGLDLFLIPPFAAMGAVVATLIAHGASVALTALLVARVTRATRDTAAPISGA
jgi:O-antigen/teichoic acid export membrane protein